MSLLSEILGLGAGAGLVTSAYNSLGDISDNVQSQVDPIATTTANMAQFQPFAVTSSLGGVNTGADGSIDIALSDQQQALTDQLGTGASGMFSDALVPRADREAEVYERIRATQRPEEERQRMALEERLFSQGRSGVRTNMYGGTPEQLALAKAQEEAQNTASLMALQQGQAEQAQSVNLGTQMLQNQQIPQAGLLSALSGGTQVASLADIGRRQSANLYGQAQMSGLEAQLGASLGQANLAGNLGAGLLTGVLTPSYGANGEVFGGLSSIGGFVDGLLDQIGL